MGLADDLGYRHSTGNPVQRTGRWLGGTRVGGWFFSNTLRHLDDVVGWLSRGKHSAPGLLTGLAVLDLTTTGRKSGQRRTSHLIATPYAGTVALLGTNFGQQSTTRDVVARPATAAESEEIFDLAARFYVGYRHYRGRVGDSRRIRVFVLEPVSAA